MATVRDLRNTIENTYRVWSMGCDTKRRDRFNSVASKLVKMLDPREIPCSFTDTGGFHTTANLDLPLPKYVLPLYDLLVEESQLSKAPMLRNPHALNQGTISR